jgi:large repetitive protein
VSDPDGYVASVRVYGNGVLLGTATATATNSSFQLMASALGQGSVTLTAIATDNNGHPTACAPVTVTITSTYPSTPVATGLKVWLAADAGITTNLSGTVTNWTDQSASGNDAVQQTNETLAPLLVANAINGKPALHFDGTNMFLEVSDEGTAFLTNDFTTFAVARFLGSYPALRQHVWSKCNTNGLAGPVDWWLNLGTGVPFGYRGDGVFFAGTGSGPNGPVLGQFSELGMTVTGSNGVMAHHLGFADNGSSTAFTNTANAGPLRIGRRLDGGTQLNGDIAEILVYNQALSATDRSNVVGYLSSKYNLVRPAYASAPPAVSVISPVNGSTSAAPATVTFAVSPSSAQGLISRVTLSANGATFATLTAPPYQVALDLLTPGTVTFTAVAQDNWGFQTTTSIVTTITGVASTPAVTSGLRVWLAADAGVTTNAAGAVTSWVDQSLNGNDAAPPAGAASPMLVPNVINGKPVLRFAGGNPGQYLEVPTDTSFTAGDISTFAMVKFNNFTGTPAYRTIWTKTANNNQAAPTDWYFASTSGNSTVLRGTGVAGQSGTSTGGAAPAGQFALVGFKASGQAITHYLGYNLNGSGNIAQTPFDASFPLRIGRRDDGGVQMNGDISEILIYDHAVSESDRLQIANYLYNKWGITVVKLHNVPPTVTLTSPTNGTPISAPGVLSVVANATDPDSPINQVNFLANGTVVATRTAPPYQIPLQVLTPGPLTLTAQAVDFWGAIGTSAPVVLTVTGSGPAVPPTSGAVLWLKADTGVTTNADGTVASLADQSGNTNNAMADLVYGFPTPFLIADVTGKPVLNYDGAVRYLDVASSPSLALTNDLSIFFAGSIDDFDTFRSICGKTQLAQPHPFDYYVNGSGLAQILRGDTRGTAAVSSSGPLSASNNVVAGVTILGSFVTHYLQGFANGSGSFGYGAIDDGFDLLIGSRDARDIYFKGNLSEILIYNRALIGNDLQLMNAYLAGRAGIAISQLSTQPPMLAAAKTGTNTLQLSWLPGYAGFILEGRTNLTSGTWSPISTNPPNNQISITTTNVARFFRLRSQ